MTTTHDNKLTLAKKFNNTGRAEFLEFRGNLKDLMQMHKHKLHTILFTGELHKAVKREFLKGLDAEGVKESAAVAERETEFLSICSEDAFAALMLNIADTTLKNKLRRDFDDDGHRAWEYIEQLHAVKDNDTRTTKAADERKSL
eukprot:5880812-Prorocentrum_lima.AAC.1